MRRSLVQLPSFILLDCVSPIDVQRLVRIHRNNDFSNECVDAPFFKSVRKQKKQRSGSVIEKCSFLGVPGTVSELTSH